MSSPLTVTLEGRHVTLTPLSIDDAPGLVEAANEDRSTYGFTRVPRNLDEMDVVVRSLLVEQERREAVPFVTRRPSTGTIIGMTRFLTLRRWSGGPFPDAAEIGGTFLAASVQRTAINTEAKLLMLTHAFEVWNVQRLDLKTDERNHRSRRAIERLGARFDGVLRNWQPSQVVGEEGLMRDSAIYSILPAEWPPIRKRLRDRLTDG